MYGKYIFYEGGFFEGRFKHNKINLGTMNYSNGESYEGEFVNGERHGAGIYRNAKGDVVLEGRWEKDSFASKSTV